MNDANEITNKTFGIGKAIKEMQNGAKVCRSG